MLERKNVRIKTRYNTEVLLNKSDVAKPGKQGVYVIQYKPEIHSSPLIWSTDIRSFCI